MTSETAPQPPGRGWSARQTLAAIGVAAAVGGVGGAAIYAATDDPSHTMGGQPRGTIGPLHGAPPLGAPPGGPSPAPTPASGALHGEYVVTDGSGGYTTKLTQTGTVDEVTPTSLVVRSDDGFTQIYAFPSAAAAAHQSVAPNDTVTIEATRTGATVTLNRIGDAPPPAK